MRARLVCTRGLPASGKTSWARAQIAAAGSPGAIVRLNRDDLRWALHGELYHLPVTEWQVTLVQHAGVAALLAAGRTVIVDDTNLNPKHLAELANIAATCGAEFEVRDFTHVPLDECIARDRKRLGSRGYVGEEIIRAMYDEHLAADRPTT